MRALETVTNAGGSPAMLLSLETTLRTVFTIYAAFWVALLVVLFVGIGFLLKKRDRMMGGGDGHDSGHGH
jgi:hypothetical protein